MTTAFLFIYSSLCSLCNYDKYKNKGPDIRLHHSLFIHNYVHAQAVRVQHHFVCPLRVPREHKLYMID